MAFPQSFCQLAIWLLMEACHAAEPKDSLQMSTDSEFINPPNLLLLPPPSPKISMNAAKHLSKKVNDLFITASELICLKSTLTVFSPLKDISKGQMFALGPVVKTCLKVRSDLRLLASPGVAPCVFQSALVHRRIVYPNNVCGGIS